MAQRAEKNTARQQLVALGNHIRKLRISRSVSQVRFAVRAGFARAYYSSLERGERNVSAINLIRLARALGVEVGALFPPISELVKDEGAGEERELRIAETDVEKYPAVRETELGKAGAVASVGEMTVPERLVSAGAAAQILGVNRRTVERWAHEGILPPATKVEDQKGKLYAVFRREDVEQLVRLRRHSE